ncbi:MAG: DUF721 domain-containing protein [Pararhodobacter sp.]|nr:DUF721 domain-containing protein [Pararhodobacter sp.]
MRGFEPAGGLLREPIRKAGESRGFAASRVLTHWAEIAGQDLAGLCRPVKVSYAEGGFGATLTLLVSGAAAPLVQMQLPALRERINAIYGYAAIARIRITQTAGNAVAAAPGMAEAAAPYAHGRESPNIAPPSPQAMQKARGVLAGLAGGVADDGLRAALERLADNLHDRQKGPGTKPRPH